MVIGPRVVEAKILRGAPPIPGGGPALFGQNEDSNSHGRHAEATCRRIGGAAIKLQVKAIPGSSRNCVAGWLGDALKVRVTAPAERGKANAAIEAVVAEALGISSASARVVAGKTSPRKVVEITGLAEAEVYRRLSKAID
jgi:uncharacterized protein